VLRAVALAKRAGELTGQRAPTKATKDALEHDKPDRDANEKAILSDPDLTTVTDSNGQDELRRLFGL
jgi:hypothetical protein